MSDPDDGTETLTELVERFLRADEALESVVDERARLAAAARDLAEARSDMAERTVTGIEALEALRTQLRERMSAEAEYAEAVSQHEGSLAELLAEVSSLLVQLRGIDPVQFARELGELRRDSADNAAEVREVRRALGEVERFQAAVSTSVQAAVQRMDQLAGDQAAMDLALREQSGRLIAGESALGERHRQLSEAIRKTDRKLLFALVVLLATLGVSVAALVTAS